jgi:hypothetical protein
VEPIDDLAAWSSRMGHGVPTTLEASASMNARDSPMARRCAEPPTRRRTRDAEMRGDGQVPGALDKIPEPMVIALLRAGRGPHADDHRPVAHVPQLLRDDAGRRSA